MYEKKPNPKRTKNNRTKNKLFLITFIFQPHKNLTS
jgi:hypothetical protein